MGEKSSANQGIVVSGNASFTANNVAVGAGATINATKSSVMDARASLERRGLQEIAERLDDLLAAIEQQGDSLADRDVVLQSTTRVAEELATDRPKKASVMAILNRVAGSVSSVAAIATGVEALKAAVGTLL